MRNDLLYQLIEVLTILPGIGKKSAQRMALYLIDKNKDGAKLMANSILEAVENIKRCQRCRMLTSEDFCNICSDKNRDKKSICVVEHISDVLAIESTGGYRGTYFVLLGRLSPMDGIGPNELGVKDLIKIIHNEDTEEVILATSSTVEGDATALYIKENIKNVTVSRISYGIPIGGELEYVDGNTIARAITGRRNLDDN